jgi:hypothetical protein
MKEQTIVWVRLIIATFILFILVLFTWPNIAKSKTVKLPPPNPAKNILVKERFALPDIPRITCEQLKELIDKKAVLLLIDSRSEMMFKKERLKGAINIPNKPLPPLTEGIIKTRISSLPKNKPIIIYCD